MELSRQIDLQSGDVRPIPAEELIIGDVMFNPNSTVGDVVARTGFTQSYVSKCVATLVKRGLLVTSVDESDRRRTLITPSRMLEGAADRRTPSLTTVFTDALGSEARAQQVLMALDELADLLLAEPPPPEHR